MDCDCKEIFRPSALLSNIKKLDQYEFNQPEMVSGTVPLWLQSSYFIALWTHDDTWTYPDIPTCHLSQHHRSIYLELLFCPPIESSTLCKTIGEVRWCKDLESGQMNMSSSSHARQMDNECRNVYGEFLEHMRLNSSFRIVIPGSEALDIEHQIRRKDHSRILDMIVLC